MDSAELNQLATAHGEEVASALLQSLLQQMPVGILVVDALSGQVVYSNRQMAEVWRGPPDPASWVAFHPDSEPYAPEDWPIQRVLTSGQPVAPEEAKIQRGDGTHGIARMSASPVLDATGRLTAVAMTVMDLTEQRRRSMSHRFLADAGTILATSLDYVSTLRNLARLAVPTLADWCTIDLLDRGGEIDRIAVEHADPKRTTTATQLSRRYPPSLKTEVGVERVIRTQTSELIREVTPEIIARFTTNSRQRKFLGELDICSAMIVPMLARGRALGAITFVTAESGRRYNPDDLELAEDLATRAALAVENSRLFDQSRAANEAKSDFLAVMSHELRTPLTAIIGYAELLQLGVPDPVTPRQHEQAERIEVSARALLQLIEEILTLVTLESGVRRVEREEVAVNKLLGRAVAIIEPMARAKGLPLSVSYASSDPILHSDPDKLLQILLNLLSNAVKFTESGEIRVSASIEESTLVIEVVDTGIGLSAEHLGRIFEPFWQVERPITRRAGGTGLGLTISKRLADLLGAEVLVESTSGQGSKFTVRIPL